jgi:hypothetical protein
MSDRLRSVAAVASLTVALLAVLDIPAAQAKDFNTYMMRAYEVVKHRSAGYKQSSYFSKDLNYGDELGVIKAKTPVGFTMCNAAVTEVIIEAINLYAAEPKRLSWSPSEQIPPESWTKADWTQLMPHLFGHDYKEYDPLEAISTKAIPSGLMVDIDDFQSEEGMAVALEKFGLGEQIPFEEAKPGDIVTFDREWTNNGGPGHSAIFLAFINDQQEEVTKYKRGKIVGFKYFSIQQSEPAGFGERWGYFKAPRRNKGNIAFCPRLDTTQATPSRCADANPAHASKKFPLIKNEHHTRDCCIIGDGDDAPRVGRLSAPPWRYKQKRQKIIVQERALRKHVQEFLRNAWRSGEQLQLFAKGALLFEKDDSDAAAKYIDKVKGEYGLDLRAIARDPGVPQVDKKELNGIFKITPKKVIRLANQQVTTKTKTQIEERVRAAAAKADLLNSRQDDGVSNRKFTGETD